MNKPTDVTLHPKSERLALLLAIALLGSSSCGEAPPGTAHADASVRSGTSTAAGIGEHAAVRVRVAEVRRAALDRRGQSTGLVAAFRTADVAAEIAGRVVARHVEPGDRVAAGDILVEQDAVRTQIAVDEATATLAARRVDVAEAQRALARSDELSRRDTVSESQHDSSRFALERAHSAQALAEASLRRAQRALADTTIRVPFAGTVEHISVDVGDYAQPGAPIARIADFSRVRLRTGVTAEEAAALHTGTRARASFAALGGWQVDGSVRSIGRIADATTGTYFVEVWLDNPGGDLREGMVARVRFAAGGDDTTLLVPRAALLRRDGQLSVFVVVSGAQGATAVARPVRIGRTGTTDAEVRSGLRAGERVVVDGHFALRNGAGVFVDERETDNAPREATWSD